MPYVDFTLEDLKTQFGIQDKLVDLFEEIPSIKPSERLSFQLDEAQELPLRSEKAKSELLVIPILMELRRINEKFFTIYSGDTLNANKEKGLIGECDFILAKDTQSLSINLPFITIVEAKKNDVEIGIAQCAAQMLGALLYNEKYGEEIKVIYGCVTTGKEWQFLKLSEKELLVDKRSYFFNDLETILGVFQQIIQYYKETLK